MIPCASAQGRIPNSKIAKAAAIESAEDDLGPPPDSPPILIRQSASLAGGVVGCDQNQPINRHTKEGAYRTPLMKRSPTLGRSIKNK